ncbi:MAG TPA: hypothetical protein VIL32_06445 [Steroidobacteraceae bacterium]
MSTPAANLRARNLRTVLALAALFFLPLAVSFWMYYATDWRPAPKSHGELIQPVRQLPNPQLIELTGGGSQRNAVFDNKWAIVYIGPGPCDEDCRAALYFMRQTRLGLNNDMTRVSRIFLATGDCCDHQFLRTQHAGMRVYDASSDEARALLEEFPPERAQSLFIVDPLGNLVMRYDTRKEPSGLLRDLKKLLKLSHIG